MESCDLVYDKKTIIRALQVFCDLGSDVGIRKGRIWLILDEIIIRAKRSCPKSISISEIIGIDSIKMGYIFGKRWKIQFQSDCSSLGGGFYTRERSSCIYVTAGSSATINDASSAIFHVIERGSDDAISIKAAINYKLRAQSNIVDRAASSPAKALPDISEADEISSPSNITNTPAEILPSATHSPHTTEKTKLKKSKSHFDSPDDIAQNKLNDIGDNLLYGLEKILAKVSSMLDIRLQSFIQYILARCLAKSSDNMVKISSIDNRN